MTHAKHTTLLDVSDKGDRIRIYGEVGPEGNALPDILWMPKIILGIRAAEYDMHPEDPRVLDMILRGHHHADTGKPRIEREDGRPPLFFMKTVAEAADFMADRIEEVRVDRRAPAAETGNRMLAGAVENKAATKALVQARDILLKSADPRLVEPIQFYRDQTRAEVAAEVEMSPTDRLLAQYRADRERAARRGPVLRTPRQ